MNLYFRDSFFNAGVTEIMNEREEPAGHIDLKSAFGSSIDVYGPDGRIRYSGGFRFFSGKWQVTGADGSEAGMLRNRTLFLTKTFLYEKEGCGTYEITSPAFSREYEITGDLGPVATFRQVNGMFASAAYVLEVQSDVTDPYEWVTVIMGMHAIQSAAANAT